jgi:SagB-type dehydrogenase family enzyme
MPRHTEASDRTTRRHSPPTRGAQVIVQLRPEARLEWSGAANATVRSGPHEVGLWELSPGLAHELSALEGGTPWEASHERMTASEGITGLALWMSTLSRLETIGAVCYRLFGDGAPLLSLTPARRSPGLGTEPPPGSLAMSRFAYLRRNAGAWRLESPLAVGPVEVHDARVLEVLAELSPSHDAPDWLRQMCALLWIAGLALPVDPDGATIEDREPALRSWEFEGLLMHSRSRSERADQALGGTYRWRGVLTPESALKPSGSGRRISLPIPDLGTLAASDPPFAAVMEQRRSIRRHGAVPMTLAQLAEFLYRVARVRDPRAGAAMGAPFEVLQRITPGAGACHPLEVYPVVGRCEGLAPGIYRYDPLAHALEGLDGGAAAVEQVLESYAGVMEPVTPPHVAFCLTARFLRMSWKYEGMAYATILKDVGVLYEAMYLAATAMRLAPCAVGGGNTALIVRALGLDRVEEGPVGEFLLGSLP